MRHTKDFVNQHTPAEARVREATSNDPWHPPQTLLQEIAESTFKSDELRQTMDMLFKRMNDSGKVGTATVRTASADLSLANGHHPTEPWLRPRRQMWRHVIKSLSLLDYLIKNGSERVVDYANRHLAEIKTLKVRPIPSRVRRAVQTPSLTRPAIAEHATLGRTSNTSMRTARTKAPTSESSPRTSQRCSRYELPTANA